MIPLFPSAVHVPAWWGGPPHDPSEGDGPDESLRSETGAGILRDKRVVIVEDEAITQLQLRKICHAAGMHVVGLAADGEQGVHKVLETSPDMVLLDINLPLLDGLSAAERILKKITPCVVMLTAYDGEEYRRRAQELGTCGYIVKPVTSSTLLPKLQAAYRQFQRPTQ